MKPPPFQNLERFSAHSSAYLSFMEPTISPFKEEDDDSLERQEKEINEFLSEVEKSEVEKMIDIKFSKIFNQFEVFTVFTLLIFTSMSCNMDNGILAGAAENIKHDLSIENL